MDQPGDRQCGLVQRELPTDARARAGTEGLEQRRGAGGRGGGFESIRVEELGVVAPLRLPVQRPGQHGERLALPNRIAIPDHRVRQCHSIEAQYRRRQAQGLVEHLPQIGQFADVVVGGQVLVVGAEDLVHLGSNPCQHRRMVQQIVEGIRHQLRGGELPRDQERHDLVACVAASARCASIRWSK